MRLTAIILLSACLTASAKSGAQGITLSVKNASLEKLFTEIKKQTGYSFVYNNNLIAGTKKISLTVSRATVDEVLQLAFKDQPLTYEIIDRTIVVKPKAGGMSPAGGGGNEHSELTGVDHGLIDITGKVTDADGNPLVGASVKVKNSTKGTTTNSEGVFTLKGLDDDAVLEISYIGYETRTVSLSPAGGGGLKAGGGLVILKQKAKDLNEIVINKGYYTEKQRETVGNVATVTAAEIEKQPVQNPLLTLQGRVPGLVVTQLTGMNSGNVQVRIQGQNSFRPGALEPLIVIDGVPYPSQTLNPNLEIVTAGGSPLNYISPSDIESISVLKDADATAIYGSRAGNGAILISTKKGKAGKPKLSVDVQQGWGKVTRHVDMMNTRQYLDMRYEAYKNDGIDLATEPVNGGNYDLKLWDTTRYTDWQKELIGGTARYTNINAGVSGGTELVQYLIGANYNRRTTVFPGDFANKSGGLHFNLNGASPNQRLHIQLSGNYNYNQNELPVFDLTQSAVLLEPDAPKLYNDDGSLNWAINPRRGRSSWRNPLAKTAYTEYNNAAKNLVSNLNLSYFLFPGLVFSSNFGYNNLQADVYNGFKLEYNPPEFRPFAQRSSNFGKSNISTWIIEPQLRFEKNISMGKLEALIGSTIQKSTGSYLQVNAFGQPTNELLHSIGAATSVNGLGSEYIRKFNGLFGRVGYKWHEKYLVNLTGRRDGSSKFGDENKFHNFLSAGAGWIFSEEKFLRWSKSWLSFGKLRASYGTTGNDQISDYSYLSLYNIVNSNILYQGTTSFDVQGLSNPFLQWEETRKLQGGIDLSASNERIALSLTYSRNRSSNQLIPYSLPDLTGFSNFTKNFPASIQNTSWEFSLNTANVKSKNFNWTTNFNITIPHNKVTSFPGIELTSYASGTSGVIVGEPIGILKLYQYGGVDPATGGYMLIDTLGKPSVPTSLRPFAQSQRVSLLPKFYGGLSNSISYKGFQLDFLFQFVYQMGAKDMYYTNPTTIPGAFTQGTSNMPVSVLNRWQKPGDNAVIARYNSDYSITIWPPYTNAGYSYGAGSYIRLKNVSLSWQLPDAWSKSAHLQTAQIYFRGQNLATITGYKGLDPETRSISTLPPLQMWTVGARIEL